MSNEEIFAANFERKMRSLPQRRKKPILISQFKTDNSSLYKAIMESMEEAREEGRKEKGRNKYFD